jgi:hypothetical protein
MKRLFPALLFFFAAAAIHAQAYMYSDGSSNNYNITYNKLEYIPVKKENSSSGTYSGGKARIIKLKLADFEILKGFFEEAIKSSDLQNTNREMGTGLVYKADKAGTKVILKPDSRIKENIEKKLKDILR